MNSLVRLALGLGIFVAGYYLGRGVTQTAYIRRELEKSHTTRAGDLHRP